MTVAGNTEQDNPAKGREELRDQPPPRGTQKPTDTTQIPTQPPPPTRPPPQTPAASSPRPP
ncbi:hypothetical protein [Streptomyces graminifolii]|uniref:hypothetical protein n=1 Tax=Streptomyces graminifolii TaxID=1266771 RepID=UPI00405827DB